MNDPKSCIKNLNKIIDNVINVSSFCSDIHFQNKVLACFAEYFIDRVNYIITPINSNPYEPEAILMGSINQNIHVKNKIVDINPKTEDQKQFIEFRKRIKEGYSQMALDPSAEVEFLSSLVKGKGYGKQLISQFESFISEQGINKYYLFTNEMCNYKWYDAQNFVLVNSKTIDISDLDLIFKDKNEFKIFIYKKKIK